MPDDDETYDGSSFDDPSFLDHCPTDHAAIYGLWSAKRGRRAVPAWSAFSPADLRPWRDWIGLIDVMPGALSDGDDFFYARIGARISRKFGRDLTGKRLSEQTLTVSRRLSLENLRGIVATRRPRFRSSPLFCVNGKTYDVERLFLPLGEDGTQVDRILFYGRPVLHVADATPPLDAVRMH